MQLPEITSDLAITHKLGEESLQLSGGSLGNGYIHPRDWVGHLNWDEQRRRRKLENWLDFFNLLLHIPGHVIVIYILETARLDLLEI